MATGDGDCSRVGEPQWYKLAAVVVISGELETEVLDQGITPVG